jgi:hypothetical protein
MVFFLEITNIWQKYLHFWFADFFLETLKILRLAWIFGCFECVSSMFFKVITNLKFYKCCFIKEGLQMHFCIIGLCLVRKEIHRLGHMDLKIYSIERLNS